MTTFLSLPLTLLEHVLQYTNVHKIRTPFSLELQAEHLLQSRFEQLLSDRFEIATFSVVDLVCRGTNFMYIQMQA